MEPAKSRAVEDTGASLAPLRILVQSATHLVPGNNYFEKCKFLQNKICQRHWHCDFDPQQHRWIAYDADFAFANRRCYFVLDYGHSTTNDVPILSYEWKGKDLNPKPELAQSSKIRKTLDRGLPFSKPLPPKPQKYRKSMREFIRQLLHQDIPFATTDFKHILEHPDDAKWLQEHLEPRLWLKVENGLQHLEEIEKATAEGRMVSWRVL